MLVVLSLLLIYESQLPAGTTVLLGVFVLAAIGAGTGLRAARPALLREAAPIPVLLGLGVLAVESPLLPLSELLVGLTGVVFVAWLMDDPARPPAGVSRGMIGWTIPALGVGVAWASSFLLPSRAAPVGVAGGLLAGALVLLAYLISRPDLFDRPEPTTI